jgi:hypothetical protein
VPAWNCRFPCGIACATATNGAQPEIAAPNPVMWTREIPFIDPVAAAARLRSLPGLAFLDSAMRP